MAIPINVCRRDMVIRSGLSTAGAHFMTLLVVAGGGSPRKCIIPPMTFGLMIPMAMFLGGWGLSDPNEHGAFVHDLVLSAENIRLLSVKIFCGNGNLKGSFKWRA